jgi:CRP-like cAMP-binding protein
MIQAIIDRLNGLSPMNKKLTERVKALTKIVSFPAGAFILKEGQICNKACMVIKGLARSYYINQGKDITSRFMD